MPIRVTQLTFNAGELSSLMAGRSDDSKYAAGLSQCRNALVTPQGPIENRPGFMRVLETKYPNRETRLIPFTYSADQTMIIELGDRYARFHTMGKTVMNGGAPYEIATPWAAEDLFALHYAQNADVLTIVHPKYPPKEIRRYSSVDWRCEDVKINTSLAAPTGVTATRITEAADDKNADKYTQKYVVTALNEDRDEESVKSVVAEVKANLYATGTTVQVQWQASAGAKHYRVYKIQGGIYGYIGETQELSIVDDNIAPELGKTPPVLDDVFKMAKGITSARITNQGSGYKWLVNAVKDPKMPLRNLDGQPITFSVCSQWSSKFIEPSVEVIDEAGIGSGAKAEITKVSYSESQYEHDRGDDSVTVYCKYTSVEEVRITNRGTNYVRPRLKITGGRAFFTVELGVIKGGITVDVEDPTGRGAQLKPVVQNGRIVDLTIIAGGSNYTSPRVVIRSEYGSGATGEASVGQVGDYPTAVGYFEQRRVFAGSYQKPQQIWMTKTGTEGNMSYHIPSQDDDRISFKVASRELNQIQHVVAMQQLIMLTSAAEWRVSPLNSDAITPTSISVRPQSYVGASSVQPILVNNTLLYPAARGGHLREFSYNYQVGGFQSGDLSLRAEHLFNGQNLQDIAFAKAPYPVVWCVSTSGLLLGLTYVPEQQVGAWHSHETKGFFESCAVVQEGDYDALYVVVAREINGKKLRFVERMTPRRDQAQANGLFLDCAAEYTGSPTAKINGLTWLIGETVNVLADGAVLIGLKVAEDGSLDLGRPVSTALIGLPYETRVQTLPVAMALQDGSASRGHVKNVNEVWLRLFRSSGVSVGPDFTRLTPLKARHRERVGVAPELKTGEFNVTTRGSWAPDGSICISQKDPLPFTLVTLSSEVEIGG